VLCQPSLSAIFDGLGPAHTCTIVLNWNMFLRTHLFYYVLRSLDDFRCFWMLPPPSQKSKHTHIQNDPKSGVYRIQSHLIQQV
jgi:hypothetical protein